MLRRSHILTAAALMAVCAAPASATPYEDLRSPDAKDAAREAGTVHGRSQDLRSPDSQDAAAHKGAYARDESPAELMQDLRSPDARDAARDLPRVVVSPPLVKVREVPSSSFDWGDAGIGAAGVLGLFGIVAGSTLLLTARKRRRGFQVAAP